MSKFFLVVTKKDSDVPKLKNESEDKNLLLEEAKNAARQEAKGNGGSFSSNATGFVTKHSFYDVLSEDEFNCCNTD